MCGLAELIGDGKILPVGSIAALKGEAEEILAIMSASRITASGYSRKPKIREKCVPSASFGIWHSEFGILVTTG